MRWKHGNRYGKEVTSGAAQFNPKTGIFEVDYKNSPRSKHISEVERYLSISLNYTIGGKPDEFLSEYGLVSMNRPNNLSQWEQDLRNYGPIIAGGHIGLVRLFPVHSAGHYILVVGVTGNGEIEYFDSLRPGHTRGSNRKPSLMKWDNPSRRFWQTDFKNATRKKKSSQPKIIVAAVQK